MTTNITREARAAALAMARSYPPRAVEPYSLRSYYWSLAESLKALERGTDDPDDCEAFVCYDNLDFDPDLQQRFKERWAKEIGQASGLIHSLAGDLKQALERNNP